MSKTADVTDPDERIETANAADSDVSIATADVADSDGSIKTADVTDPNSYYEIKMDLLKQILSINEEILSNPDDWESYKTHLSARESIIRKLQKLDDAFGVDVIRCCPRSQIVEMDRMLNLILALDKDIIAVIDENRQKILASLKATVREKKITGYGNPVGHSGKYLDSKE
ncbi:MAG: hypothetical protein QM289_04810 [Bacillota bacterium]|nr:hypothetical protein [Bacillota bacterium]